MPLPAALGGGPSASGLIYRILTGAWDGYWDHVQETHGRFRLPMLGAGPTLGDVMEEPRLPASAIANPRMRFGFTARG